uniref:Ig-like domain-containing protein n=1 Tax=Oreochromis aureus TaxID=47969 RepID=A0A668SJB4_OREAU
SETLTEHKYDTFSKIKLLPLDMIKFHDQVFQTPANMYKNQGQRAEINCSHSIAGYDRILWYKQTKSKQLHFLGYMVVSQGAPESGWRVDIKGSANPHQTCTLIIKDLTLNSSAVYFCAARYHSTIYQCSSIQKPLHS